YPLRPLPKERPAWSHGFPPAPNKERAQRCGPVPRGFAAPQPHAEVVSRDLLERELRNFRRHVIARREDWLAAAARARDVDMRRLSPGLARPAGGLAIMR